MRESSGFSNRKAVIGACLVAAGLVTGGFMLAVAPIASAAATMVRPGIGTLEECDGQGQEIVRQNARKNVPSVTYSCLLEGATFTLVANVP